MKAKHCDECIYFTPKEPFTRSERVCAKDHRPRFYKPKNLHCVVFNDSWGWKRRCNDFEIHPLQALADQAQGLGIE